MEKLLKIFQASKGISIDSRSQTKGCVFFAIKGRNYDGHDYVKSALAAGAICAVVEKPLAGIAAEKIILVDSTRKMLGKLASAVRQRCDYKVIAITGSVGKTSTKAMLNHVLAAKYKCYTSPKSFNNDIGLPFTLLNAPADSEVVITELGSNNCGEIEALSEIAEPDIAVITAATQAHLEGFGSLAGVVKEKTSIVKHLKPDGKFFINGNYPELVEYCRTGGLKYETFGTNRNCDIKAENIKMSSSGSEFEINAQKIFLPAVGAGNLENAVAAFAVCRCLGITAEQFAQSVGTFSPVEMRMQITNLGRLILLNDCYNANPASMANALGTLAMLSSERNRRSVFIFGAMGELGQLSGLLHEDLGRAIAANKINVALTVAGDCAMAAKAALQAAEEPIAVKIFENITQLCDNLYKFVETDDIVLVKASRSQKFEQATEKLKTIFA